MASTLGRAVLNYAKPKVSTEPVDIGGNAVYVREISADQAKTFFELIKADEDELSPKAIMLIAKMCACDKDGTLLWSDADDADLGQSSIVRLKDIALAAIDFNAMNATGVEALGND